MEHISGAKAEWHKGSWSCAWILGLWVSCRHALKLYVNSVLIQNLGVHQATLTPWKMLWHAADTSSVIFWAIWKPEWVTRWVFIAVWGLWIWFTRSLFSWTCRLGFGLNLLKADLCTAQTIWLHMHKDRKEMATTEVKTTSNKREHLGKSQALRWVKTRERVTLLAHQINLGEEFYKSISRASRDKAKAHDTTQVCKGLDG